MSRAVKDGLMLADQGFGPFDPRGVHGIHQESKHRSRLQHIEKLVSVGFKLLFFSVSQWIPHDGRLEHSASRLAKCPKTRPSNVKKLSAVQTWRFGR